MSEVAQTKPPPGAGPETGAAPGSPQAALARILGEGVDVHRCLAARALGGIGAPESVGPLVGALLDEDADVRTDAAEALLRIGDRSAADQLFENLLGDPCTEVKIAAIQALAGMEDERILPWLRRLVKGRDEGIVWDEQEFHASGWDDWADIQVQAITALADMGIDAAAPDIVSALKEDVQDIAETAFKALARLGKPGIDGLADFLNDPNTRTRRRAASAIAGSGSEYAETLLPMVFSDPSPEVRLAALQARAEADPSDPMLAVMLEDEDENIRAEALQLMGQMRRDDLSGLLEDPSPKVRATALDLLAELGEEAAGDALIERIGEMTGAASPAVAASACRAYAALAPGLAGVALAGIAGDTDRQARVRLGAIAGLARIGGADAADALIGCMDDGDRQVRQQAMVALAGLARDTGDRPDPCAGALLAALGGRQTVEQETADPEPDAGPLEETEPEADGESGPESQDPARDYAKISTLAAILQERSGDAPDPGLPDEDVELTQEDIERLAIARRVTGKRKVPRDLEIGVAQDVRRFAARVLGDLDHEDVIRALLEVLGSEDEEVALGASDSLARIAGRAGRLPEDGERRIAGMLPSVATVRTKLHLIRALAAGGSDQAAEAIAAQIPADDRFVRAEAIRALSCLRRDGFDFEPLLSDSDPSVRLAAAEAVAASPGPRTVGVLADFALSFEGYHGRRTARLLRGLDRKRANDAFLAFLADAEKRRYWAVAIEALEELNRKSDEGGEPRSKESKPTRTNTEVYS